METSIDSQAVDNFLRLTRGAQSKQDFLSKVREFDQRFVDAYPAPTMNNNPPSIPKSSTSNLKNTANYDQPIKNPFVNSNEDKFRGQRTNPFQQQTSQISGRGAGNGYQIPQSRSESNFYKQVNNQPDFSRYHDQYYGQNLQEMQGNFVNSFAMNDEPPYRQSGSRQYPQQYPEQRSKSYLQMPQQNYQSQQPPYIPGNEFLSNYEADQPKYVTYYKKPMGGPPAHSHPKLSMTPTARSQNPFKG